MKGSGVDASSEMGDKSHTRGNTAADSRNLILLSQLLALAMLVVLWCSRSQPLLVVWLLSSMLCFVMCLWTIFLADTMDLRVFIYNSYGILLAFCANMVLSPSIAALIAHFSTHFAACLLGYALADHRQREGTERAADLVPITAKEEQEEFRQLLLWILSGLMASVLVFAILTELASLMWHAEDYRIEELVAIVLFLLSAASVLGIFFVAVMQLRGSLISPLGFVFTCAYVGLVFAFHLGFSMILGDVAAMVITWVACLGLTGFLGYSMSVLATYKQMKRETALVELQNKRS
ncbi:hypothetical protein QOZ80_6AG0537680 [Eleusine coracana subsp. coracana]|nr:hypothetical protein QOZ80_6AG0537680 [Eleusine coracana subsp. coracana]